ncbi:hypothetical protein LPJ57_005363 [Coemansia sp. RSA 486]|nr:hypothetical protein LPJ57_005363 [Coemansia sp. RSA 486]KAJ2639252.1 hypothetical protein GGF40_001021 [Coemansia sp. RSA 1286]KAJ2706833.1 hypothetical protein FB645_001281 [Coemansia sp. IMI 203386]
MHHFVYDFAKPGAFDITNGAATVTINSVQHNVDVCVCKNCVEIRAKKRAEEEKRKLPPPPPPCCYHHHHCCSYH